MRGSRNQDSALPARTRPASDSVNRSSPAESAKTNRQTPEFSWKERYLPVTRDRIAAGGASRHDFPARIGVDCAHFGGDSFGPAPEILLIDHAAVADDKGHDAGIAIIDRPHDHRQSA